MNRTLKFIEPHGSKFDCAGPFYEMAVHVRDLLKCEYALVATGEAGTIRVRAIAGGDGETSRNLAIDLISKLGDWGPVVVDDSRLIAVPVQRDSRAIGLLVAYSSQPGTFTADELARLTIFSHVAGETLEKAAASGAAMKTSFTTDELLHLSRLITAGELSACFAHEVNNPLTLIRGHLRLIDDDLPEDHPTRHNYEAIDRASRRIEEIAKRMLDFSRKRTPYVEECDIAELVSDALRFMQPYFHGLQIDVQIKIEPDLPHPRVDRSHIIQVFVNLLQNAADAMAGVDRRCLTIRAQREGNRLQIGVTDTGTGIATPDVTRMFEPFYTTKGEGGTGLGLYITRRVIEDHKGTISVQTGDTGTTFLLSLPL